MEIIIRSEYHSGHGLDALEGQIEATLGDCGRITGGGAGIDGWHLYVELFRDPTAGELNCLAVALGRLDVPKGTFIQCVGLDGKTRKLKAKAEQHAG